MPMPGNRDIMEAVGLEYKHVSYEPKPKQKKKAWERRSPHKVTKSGGEDDEFAEEDIAEGD